MGAFAAGAAIAQPVLSDSGARLGAAKPAATWVAPDRYRGVAGFEALLANPSISPGGGEAGISAAAFTRSGLPFDIPAGKLATVLEAFAIQSGLEVELAAPELGEIQSPGVSGVFAPSAALERLLEGTGTDLVSLGGGAYRVALPGLHEEVRVVDELRVLSPKHTEPLLDTPQSITIVDSELLHAQGATSLRDALRNVTGISIQAGEGGGGLPGDNLAIRGFAARSDIFVDGVRDFGAYSRDPYNIEQVEVSKGPASAFSGRGSTGGAINLVTKMPSLDGAIAAELSAGSDAFSRATVDYNRPLEDHALGGAAVRVNAMYTAGDAPGRDAVENERFGVSAAFAAGLEGDTRLWVSGSFMEEDNLPDYGIPWVPPTNIPLAEYADGPPPVDFDNFYGLVDRDFENVSTGIATATVDHDLNPSARLRFLVRGGESERDSVITAPRFASNNSTMLNRQLQSRVLDDRILDAQGDLDLRLTTGDVEHAIVAGVELSREQAENRARTAPPAPLADLFDPDPETLYDGNLVFTGAGTENQADTIAAYAFDTMQLGEKLEVTGGLRYDRLDVDFTDRAITGVETDFARSDDMLSWRAGAVYKPRPEGSLYASAGTSFNPSSDGNTGLSLTAATVQLEPEKSRSIELGAKWEFFERRLLATAALFETEKTNARTPGIDPGDPPTVLEGRQQVRGFEVGLNGRITDAWSAFAGYTYLQSEVLESNVPAEVGKELANAPEHSFSAWTSYRFAVGLELGVGAQFVGDRWNSPTNVRQAPSFWKLDASAAYDLNTWLSLRLNVYNLTDEVYIDRVGGGHFVPGAARSATISTGLKF